MAELSSEILPPTLTVDQKLVGELAINNTVFLEGLAGSGKTTAGVAHLLGLIDSGVPAETILILVPQRTLAAPYYQALRQPGLPAGSISDIVTLGGLGQRMIELFWPLVAGNAGFKHPDHPPIFLTLETAQYYLARLVKPLREEGFFETVKIDQNRLMSQILDNLNKAAAVGFDYRTIAERLKNAWVGEPAQQNVYTDAQECANRFRSYCLENNLLDFSLQMEVFNHHLWKSFLCRSYLFHRYRHLIYDNIEEDVPVVFDIIHEWLPQFDSALLIYDLEGGYRAFLGADPKSSYLLKQECHDALSFSGTHIMSAAVESFGQVLKTCMNKRLNRDELPIEISKQIQPAFQVSYHPYYPIMIDWVAQETSRLVREESIPPGDIVILAPFLSDSLRFSLENRLSQNDIPVRSSRPSRSLGDEPASRCLLTLAKLAHPEWKMNISQQDLRYALMQAIDGMDLVRADLLAKIVHRPKQTESGITSFNRIQPEMQERITYTLGERYERLRQWILNYRSQPPSELDVFLSQLFGEVLSQPGFVFHVRYDAAAITARLVESVQKFRRAVSPQTTPSDVSTGQEYVQMVEERVVAAQYLQNQDDQRTNAVLLAPATTFLMNNYPVNCQFWLDIGSIGWWERLHQPLTHPYVLSRHWDVQARWTDADEIETNYNNMVRLTSGLLHRCRERVYLCAAGINEQGDEQRGPMLQAIQALLRHFPSPQEQNV